MPEQSKNGRAARWIGIAFLAVNTVIVTAFLIATRGGTGVFHTEVFGSLLLLLWADVPLLISIKVLRSVVSAVIVGVITVPLILDAFWTLLTSEHSTAPVSILAPAVAIVAVLITAGIEWAIRRLEGARDSRKRGG